MGYDGAAATVAQSSAREAPSSGAAGPLCAAALADAERLAAERAASVAEHRAATERAAAAAAAALRSAADVLVAEPSSGAAIPDDLGATLESAERAATEELVAVDLHERLEQPCHLGLDLLEHGAEGLGPTPRGGDMAWT